MLKVGKLVDILLACREKKPWFWVEYDGYPLTSALLALAVSHEMLVPADPIHLVSKCFPAGGISALVRTRETRT